MPRVKFITTGHSHLTGNFSTGDIFTGPEEACRHFVEDAHCAVWDEVQTPAQQPTASAQSAKPRRAAKAKTPAPTGADAQQQPPSDGAAGEETSDEAGQQVDQAADATNAADASDSAT